MAEMTKKRRLETYALLVLLVFLAYVFYVDRGREAVFMGLGTSDAPFRPLEVSDPALRLDLLNRMQHEEYKGEHRNIFAAARPPAPVSHVPKSPPIIAPPIPRPSGPPPLVVPATLFGIVTEVATGQRKAVFSGAENDVFVVPEGGTLMGQYRVDKIGANSVEVEEISTGRKATLILATPAESSSLLQAQS